MKRNLMRLALAASFLLTAGVAPSAADTITAITADNIAFHPHHILTIAGLAIMLPCEPHTMVDCIDFTTVVPVTVAAAEDDGTSLPFMTSASGSAGVNTQLDVETPPGVTAVPEPGSMLLLGSGLLLFARIMRARRA